MQHLLFQDILSIVGLILGPILALVGLMWHHFDGHFKEIRGEMKGEIGGIKEEMKGIKKEIKDMEIRLTNKIDASYKSPNEQISMDRERISRIEGQLTPTQIIRFQSEETPKKRLKTKSQPASA